MFANSSGLGLRLLWRLRGFHQINVYLIYIQNFPEFSLKCIYPNYFLYCFKCCHRVCPNLSPELCIMFLSFKLISKISKRNSATWQWHSAALHKTEFCHGYGKRFLRFYHGTKYCMRPPPLSSILIDQDATQGRCSIAHVVHVFCSVL